MAFEASAAYVNLGGCFGTCGCLGLGSLDASLELYHFVIVFVEVLLSEMVHSRLTPGSQERGILVGRRALKFRSG